MHAKALAILILLVGFSARAEFRNIRELSSKYGSVRLHVVDSNPRFANAQYVAVYTEGDLPFSDESENYVELLDFKFQNLSAAQFHFLKKTYGLRRSQVEFNPGMTYYLSDFLPPFAKAVLNKNFIPELEMDGDEVSVLMSNCWGTVYEFARMADTRFQVFMSPNWDGEIAELTLLPRRHIYPSAFSRWSRHGLSLRFKTHFSPMTRGTETKLSETKDNDGSDVRYFHFASSFAFISDFAGILSEYF